MLALLSFARRQSFDLLAGRRKRESISEASSEDNGFCCPLFPISSVVNLVSAKGPNGHLYLRTGPKFHLFVRTGFVASYRMLADSLRRAHAIPNLPSARVTLPIPAGSSTAGAQPCLHDSAKFWSKTA